MRGEWVMFDYVEDKPLSELFDIQPEAYENISVLTLPFSARVLNRFNQKHIDSVQDLLQVDIAFLKSIRGFGDNCLSQVFSYCEELSKIDERIKTEKHVSISKVFTENRDLIALGDFSFADDLILSEKQEKQLADLKRAYDILGEELALECVCSPEKIRLIISAFSTFITKRSRLRELENIFYQIPDHRKKNNAKYYIDAFSYDDNVRNKLCQFYSSVDDELGSIIKTINSEDEGQVLLAKKFLHWCTFNLTEEITLLFEKVYSSSRIQTVIEGRANNLTLNELGEQLGITRERVRQIEAKAKRVFVYQQARIKIMSKIYADKNGQTIITHEDVESVSGNNVAALIYLLKNIEGSIFTYDHQLDVFVFSDDDLSSRIQDYVDTLPRVLHKTDLPNVLKTAQEEYGLDSIYVEKALYEVYKITGDVYHRSRLSLAKIYDIILRKYYANGIHIYDDNEIASLRQHIYNDYGNINLPSSNHAIAARIAIVCMLAGRGIYIPKKGKLISKDLAQKLLSFIMDSSSPILLVNNVFSVFEEELEREGINNRYHLQGVLRELFGDKLYFRRDYVSRDKGFTSIYSSIVKFIKASKYPIKKEEIKVRFKGITDMVIAFATSDSDILNYFGEYMHASNLVVRKSEKDYLAELLTTILVDGEAHHIKDIFLLINNVRSELFSRNAVTGSYSAFSMLEYLFREKYQFSRPYIALDGVEIGRPNERLQEMLYSKDQFFVSDITEFAKDNHMHIQSIIEYVNSLNDKFLLINADNLVSIDEIGVNSIIANKVETIICNEINVTIPIRDLQCISQFPSINVSWNEWLIYSVLKKWSRKLDVALSHSQLRHSIPLVSVMGQMDTSEYKDVSPAPVQVKIDNMDDIDNLLADILSDEILEEKE